MVTGLDGYKQGSNMINKQGVLAGQVAMVTGASRGIGVAVAKRMAMEGARIIVTARTVDAADHYLPGTIAETVDQINAAGGEAVAIQADLALPDERERLMAEAMAAFGQIDILVNNAAVTFFIPVETFPEKRFRLMMDVQVWTPFQLSQLVIPGMRERGHGWILNISSHAAIHPDKTAPGRGAAPFTACARRRLERFTTGLAQELYDDGIGVNVISPGLVATPGAVHHNLINEQSQHRVTPVEHMAEACLRLCHGDPRQFTGRIDYADEVMKEFDLQARELI